MKPNRDFTVSVIVPTYNRSYCVGEAIDSILSQSCPADEIVVVDDGSTDNTNDILSKYKDHIIVIRQANSGAAAARNTGIRNTTGTWITFLDSDDLWLPGRLAALRRDLASAEEDVIAHTGDMYLTGSGPSKELFSLRDWQFPQLTATNVINALPRAMSGIFPLTTAIRRDAALAEGGFREHLRVHEDTALFCMLALRGPWLFTGDILGEARRMIGDSGALSSIERKHPFEAATARVSYTSALLKQDLTPDQRDLVMDQASNALLILSAAEHAEKIGTPRRTAIASAQQHSSALKGWLKALPPIVLGNVGYRISLSKHRTFTRS